MAYNFIHTKRPNKTPHNAAPIPTVWDPIRYTSAFAWADDDIKLKASKVIVEKVVKEPIKPVRIIKAVCPDIKCRSFARVHAKPNKRHPTMLTVMVPQGNTSVAFP